MYVQKGKVHMPEINTGKWINSKEIRRDELIGKVVLVDFWDYTCVNCIRTLPYIKEWYNRYHEEGLEIIGVHAPEFAFSRTEENVRKGIEEFEIKYPVVMDNDYKIWNSFANRYWPSRYLIDKHGYFRYAHFGEGNYIETELAIQLLLKEINPNVNLPDPMKPVRDTDILGMSCHRVSPELYFGFNRGKLGNPEDQKNNEVQSFMKPDNIQEDTIYVEGKWLTTPEFMVPASDNPNEIARIYLKYSSVEVKLVINPESERDFKVSIMQDNKFLTPEDAGDDVLCNEEGKSYISVKEAKLYNLVKNKDVRSHTLQMSTTSNGFAVYAFTFTSCVI